MSMMEIIVMGEQTQGTLCSQVKFLLLSPLLHFEYGLCCVLIREAVKKVHTSILQPLAHVMLPIYKTILSMKPWSSWQADFV